MKRPALNLHWRGKPGMLLLLLLIIGSARLVQGVEGITVSEPTVYRRPRTIAANGTVLAFYDVWGVKIYALGEVIGGVSLRAYPSFGHDANFSNATALELRGAIDTGSLIPGFDHFYIEFTAKQKDDPNWVKNVKEFLVNTEISRTSDIREYDLGSTPAPDPAELAEWGFTRLGEVREFILTDFYVEFSVKGNVFEFNISEWVPSVNLTLATDDSMFKETALVDSGDMGNGWWYWKLDLTDWESRYELWRPNQAGERGYWGATAVFNTEPKPVYAKTAFIGDKYEVFTSPNGVDKYMLPQKYNAYVLAFFNRTGEVKGNMTVRLVLHQGISSYHSDLFTVPVDITITETGRFEVFKPTFTIQTFIEPVGTPYITKRIHQYVNFTEPTGFGRHDYVTLNFHCTVKAPHGERYVQVESDPHLQTLRILDRHKYGKYLIYGLYNHFLPYSTIEDTLSGNVTHLENGWIVPYSSNLEEYEVYLSYMEVKAETELYGGEFNFTLDDITVHKLPRPKFDPIPMFYDPMGKPVSKQEYDLSMEAYSLRKQALAMIDAAIDPYTLSPIFHSAEAVTALKEASNETFLARQLLLLSYNYTDAKQHAQNAVDLITKAYNTEQSYQRTQLLIKWAPIITLIAIIGGAGALILKRKMAKRASCSHKQDPRDQPPRTETST